LPIEPTISIAPPTLAETRALARRLAQLLFTAEVAGSCDDVAVGEQRCLDRERRVSAREFRGFDQYRPDRMCSACRAYFFAERAAQTLEEILRDRQEPTVARRRVG
jgi:hypothetical protein